jgi:glucosamine--fructose-6-phosphate aminotransferase (isomerizing)
MSESGTIAVVHNGIIENYSTLKKQLISRGKTFQSQTDTEIITQLIEEIYNSSSGISFENAIQLTLKQVVGTYGLAVIHEESPDKIYIARKGSPLLLGIGDGEMFIASDASPIIEYTNKVVYLDDGEMATVTKDDYKVKTIEDVSLTKEVHELEISLDAIEKAGYPHFMLKEIFEQPRSVADCMRGRVNPDNHTIQLGGIQDVMDELLGAKRIVIAACGTSWHSALVGEYLFEYLAKTPVEVEYASEFRYRDPLIGKGDVLLVISQSGETADTIAALREAKKKGALVLGICNVVGSTLSRETDAGVFTHAGPEIGVASTKAFTTQLMTFYLIALYMADELGTIEKEAYDKIIKNLYDIPGKVQEILDQSKDIQKIAAEQFNNESVFFIGRGLDVEISYESSLKLKEISYINSYAIAAGELKHGTIALIEDGTLVVSIATQDHLYEKMLSNIKEVKARKGSILSVAKRGNKEIAEISDYTIYIPDTLDILTPLLSIVSMQLFAYYISVERGNDVDKPRNLAKSVTVE